MADDDMVAPHTETVYRGAPAPSKGFRVKSQRRSKDAVNNVISLFGEEDQAAARLRGECAIALVDLTLDQLYRLREWLRLTG